MRTQCLTNNTDRPSYIFRRKLPMKILSIRRFSTFLHDALSINPRIPGKQTEARNSRALPIPHRTLTEPKGQDFDFVSVAHSHLIHSDWSKLEALAVGLNAFRVKHVLLKIQRDHVLSLEFFNWVKTQNPNSHSLETHCILLHILTKHRKFKSAELAVRNVIASESLDFPAKLFEALLYSYRLCDSSPRVFDSLFKTFAHLKKPRYATDTFCRMKEYGFFPTVESCNAYLSSLLDLNRVDIALGFYSEMGRARISANVYTLNMVMAAFCRLGDLQKAGEALEKMEVMGLSPNVVSYNTLIAGYCNKGLLGLAMRTKTLMEKNGLVSNVVTYNTLIHGFCKEGKLHEASKIFSEMKNLEIAPNTVTYNALINGYSQVGNVEIGSQLFEEMSRNQVKANILTYNSLILGLCKEGKTKKAAYLVKEMDEKNLVPNASTFAALITGQCVRKNSDLAFQLYKSMIRSGFQPNQQTFHVMMLAFCRNQDFDGAVELLSEMLNRAVVPDSHVLSELCNGLCRCGKDRLALMLCNEIEAKHLMPGDFDKEEIISICPEYT